MTRGRRDRFGLLLVLLVSLSGASSALAADAVSAEEWAFRFQRLKGSIDATQSLLDLFEPEARYCAFPLRPSKQDDLAMLDAWAARMTQASRDAVTLERGIAAGLRNRPRFEELTGVDPEPHVFQNLRIRANQVQRAIQAKRLAVEAAPEAPCGAAPPPPPPPPPPIDPTAGLTAPVYAPVSPAPTLPDRFCSEAEKQAFLDALKPDRQNAVDNAMKAAQFRSELSQAQLYGRGDPATLRRLHDQASDDMRAWDAKSDVFDALWKQALAMPVVDCGARTATREIGASEPWSKVNLNLAASYVLQDLPDHNAGLGVVDVGGAERDLIDLDASQDGFAIEATGFLAGLGPELFGNPSHVILRGIYGRGESNGRQTVDPVVGVVNGIGWWREQAGSSGISSDGAGLDGDYDFTTQGFSLSGGLKGELPCWGDGDGPALRFPDLFGGSHLLWEANAGFGWSSQDSTTRVMLSNPNPAFSVFDVSSRAKVDLTQWRGFAGAGLHYLQPISGVQGLMATFSARGNFGYFDASADGHQRNACDVEFAAVPGVNQCNPAAVDFDLRSQPDDDGVDVGLGFGARLDWQVPKVPGLAVGATYDLDWGSFARFKAPTNLAEDGSPELRRSYEVGQRFGLSLWYRF